MQVKMLSTVECIELYGPLALPGSSLPVSLVMEVTYHNIIFVYLVILSNCNYDRHWNRQRLTINNNDKNNRVQDTIMTFMSVT